MDDQGIMRQDSGCRYVINCNQTSDKVTKHILGRLVQTIIIFLVSVFIIGCDSGQPRYEVYPTLSIESRRDWPDKGSRGLFTLWMKDSDAALSRWRDRFESEVNKMVLYEWDPNINLLKNTLAQVSEEYGSNLTEPNNVMQAVLNVFRGKLKIEGSSDCNDSNIYDNDINGGIDRMCRLIDAEHPGLLKDGSSFILPPININPFNLITPLPDMVSNDYPVDVSPTIWSRPSPSSKSETNETTIFLAGGTVINSSKPPTIVNGCCGSIAAADQNARDKTKTIDEEKKTAVNEAEVGRIEDFNSMQCVSVSISTALNSASTLDRIEYISTYLFLQPYPFPPNGDIVLEKEFWRRFFALNAIRDPDIRERAIPDDMMRAIEDMRVHIIDTDTDLKPIIDLGSLSRHTSDTFNAALSGKVTPVPGFAEISPSLSYISGVTTDTAIKLQQQLDQRSVYVDSPGKFLRITQRGMQSVNLAGRFIENITLFIPAAQKRTPVLAMVHDSGNKVHYERKLISKPLYSRVDAFTVSVVVTRRATALAKSTKESFRLDDPKDAAFVVGITRPYRITLWQYERKISIPDKDRITFDSNTEPPAPLMLYDFTPEMSSKLLYEIHKNTPSDSCDIISFSPSFCDINDPNKITIHVRGKSKTVSGPVYNLVK
jgi:hypothetical protein